MNAAGLKLNYCLLVLVCVFNVRIVPGVVVALASTSPTYKTRRILLIKKKKECTARCNHFSELV